MRWDALLRIAGIAGFLTAYGIFVFFGARFEVLVFIIISIGTLVAPEFVHELPWGPNK